jgi:hypothetical protein
VHRSEVDQAVTSRHAAKIFAVVRTVVIVRSVVIGEWGRDTRLNPPLLSGVTIPVWRSGRERLSGAVDT